MASKVEIQEKSNNLTIAKCRAKLLYEHGMTEDEIRTLEQNVSIIIERILAKHYKLNITNYEKES